MQCSCCRIDSKNLREYAFSIDVGEFRKTIETIHLCALCRMLYTVKPDQVRAKCRQAAPAQPARSRFRVA
jgi:hypothetical protein